MRKFGIDVRTWSSEVRDTTDDTLFIEIPYDNRDDWEPMPHVLLERWLRFHDVSPTEINNYSLVPGSDQFNGNCLTCTWHYEPLGEIVVQMYVWREMKR